MGRGSSSSVKIRFPKYSREELISLLRDVVSNLADEMPLKLVTLFGSWAKGRATASSDIDLLIVYKGPKRRDAFNIVSKTLGIRGVEPHVFTVEEFAAFIKQSPRTRREWVEEAVVLFPEY